MVGYPGTRLVLWMAEADGVLLLLWEKLNGFKDTFNFLLNKNNLLPPPHLYNAHTK